MFSGEKFLSKAGLYQIEFIFIPTCKVNILQNSIAIEAKKTFASQTTS